MSLDLRHLRVLLATEARRVLRAFLATHPDTPLTALGFVFTLYNASPQLDLCAHTTALAEDDEERWNSGDYDFPAGLTGASGELGPAVLAEVARLHALAATEPPRGPAYQGLVALCGAVLLDLRADGLVPSCIDLNVAEVGDDVDIVASRHAALVAGVWSA